MSSAPTIALACGAMLVALAFTLWLWERHLVRPRPEVAAWTVSLGLFTVAAGALAWGAAVGWDGPTFRIFYAAGAVLNVPFLALGQLILQLGPARRRLAARLSAAVALAGAFSLGVVTTTPLRADIPRGRLPRGSEVLGPLPRVLAAVASGGGAAVVFAGTATAAWRAARRRRHLRGRGAELPELAAPRGLAPGTGLLALGTLVLSASGLLNSVMGEMEAFALTLALGVTILFAGFLVTQAASLDARSFDVRSLDDRPRAARAQRVAGDADHTARPSPAPGQPVSSRRSTLPEMPRGTSFTNKTFDGHL